MTTQTLPAMQTSVIERPAPPDGDLGYRDLVRSALREFDGDAVTGWHRKRHIPRSAIAVLGAAGVFDRRWSTDAYCGLDLLPVMVGELSRLDAGLALAAMGHSEIFIGALTRHGSTAWHAALLADALAGRAVGCFAATEAHGGSDLAGVRCLAVETAQGWHMTGTKRYISNVGSATHVLVLAKARPRHGTEGPALFVVPVDQQGVGVDGFFDTSGVRSCDVGQLTMDTVLPGDALLGTAGLGMLYASHLLQFERLAICALLTSAAESALELAVAFARGRRHTAGRVADRQVVRHRLALGYAETWNLRSRLEHIIETAVAQRSMPAHHIAALKLVAGQRVSDVVDMCMQVFGARGNTAAYPLESLWRDSRVARIGGGTDEVLADMVASFLDRPDPWAEELLVQAELADRPIPDR
jgi:alkylation response protein AidB-like acyl-CoA dehydrogenase